MTAVLPAHGQKAPEVSTLPPKSSVGEEPVVITADGRNTYFGEIATADDNVVLRYKGDVLYSDHLIYDRSTKIVTANGNVRLFSGQRVYRGETLTYNLDTKAITSSSFLGEEYPKFVAAKQVTTPEFNHYRLSNASFTTSNRSNPSYHLEATTVEYRPNDEVVLKNVLLFVGDVPVAYFPIFVQSLTDSRPAYQFQIGSGGRFGAFIDNKYNWVADDRLRGTVEFDAREKRGYAGGLDLQYYPGVNSDILLKTYYAQDNAYTRGSNLAPTANPNDNGNLYDGVPHDNRYRMAYEHHLQFGPDLSSIADFNLWSDPWITRDYFSGEYQNENQPPNFISLSQYNPNFTISLLASPQVNPFFEAVQRLPEFMVESKQQKIFNSPIEWTSQSSVVNFQRHFADTSTFNNPSQYMYNSFPSMTAYNYYHPNQTPGVNPKDTNNYSAYRYDTYQEFSYPHQYFNFLSLTPRIGGRLTYYSDDNRDTNDTVNNNGLSNDKIENPRARLAGDVGLSGDFKISRTWLDVKNPNLGIDGIRHVIEPFFDAQYAPAPTVSPNRIRGFDNRLYSTQLQPIDWTENNSIDSIDRQAVVRLGVWNKIQTKRDGTNYDLMTWQTYADADFDHNFSSSTPSSTMSNVFNDIRFYPTPQFQIRSFSSVDVSGNGYNQADTDITWSPDPSLKLTLGDHYINGSPFFVSGNSISTDLFYRMNEHWQFEAQEQFEATTGQLQLQRYTIYRDLDAWQLGLTFADDEYNGVHDHSIYFSLTLKAFPKEVINTPRL